MRKVFAVLIFALALSGTATAQLTRRDVIYRTGAPSGTCNERLAVNRTNGDVYSCTGGVWVKIGPTTAAVPGGSSGDIQYNNAGAFGGKSLATLKSDLALNNVDNTSDAAKPVSTAQQAALDAKQNVLTNSAGLAAALSDETGTGAVVFANSPVFTTPNIGTATGSVTGNAGTATVLAANPTDCAANQFANAIAASGNLTCAQPAASNLSNGTTGSGAVVLAVSPTLTGTATLPHIATSGSTPTHALGTPAGTGATATITGNDTAGLITLNVGTSPGSSDNIIQVSFATARTGTPRAVIITPGNLAASLLSGGSANAPFVNSMSNTFFTLAIGAGTLTASTQYKWYYWIVE